jgi:hypothetical protein
MPELKPSNEKPKRRKRKLYAPDQRTSRSAQAQNRKRLEIDERLDAGLEETFPASDPVAVDSRSD